MVKDGSKQNYWFDNIFVFVLIIYAGKATAFSRSLETWDHKFGLFFPLIFGIYVAFVKNIKISERFGYLLLGYLGYNVLLTIKFNVFHPRFLGIYLISICLTYITISAYRVRFFTLYMNVLYYLAIISFVFWIIQLIIPEQLNRLMNSVISLEPGAGNVRSTIVFYTINTQLHINTGKFVLGGITFLRNAGFAWEPGAFAVLLNFGILINLITNRFSLHDNKKLWVFIGVLITTFSTTGYSLLMLLTLFYLYNTKNKLKVLMIPLIIGIGLYILTLPFMLQKVIEISEVDTDYEIRQSIINNTARAPQRINSFIIDFQDFMKNPFIGYGGHSEAKWTAILGARISTISGIGKIFAVFGLVGATLFLALLYQSSKLLAILFDFKGWFFPFLFILMISISYSLIFSPIFMCLWMLSLFHPKIRKKKSTEKYFLV